MYTKIRSWPLVCALILAAIAPAAAQDRALYVGVLHPNGTNLFGYSVEKRIDGNLYWFYAFGLPTVAAIGVSYYADRDGNGPTATLGTSLGSYAYASIAYQVSLGNRHFLKFGAGGSDGFGYEAAFHPVIAYEHRF